jgi:general secretion pathway protein G
MKKILRSLTSRSQINTESGFSLIELLIVMVILGMLASLVGPKMFGKLGMAKQKTAKTQIEMLMTALDSYRLDIGKYPTGLDALVENSGGDKWQGPYLAKGLPKDPWDNEYEYFYNEGEPYILSYGADGQAGGDKEDADVDSRE